MPTVIIRSLLGRVGSVVLALGAAAVLGMVLRSDGVAGLVPVLGWGGLAGVAVWALWWAPAITLSDEHLRVRNAWRTHVVPGRRSPTARPAGPWSSCCVTEAL